MDSYKRLLTSEEIDNILVDLIPDEFEWIKQFKNYDQLIVQEHANKHQIKNFRNKNVEILPSSLTSVIENNRSNIRKQLESIEIVPECIPELKAEIMQAFHRSRIQPGEMVGCLAASSIGEQFTQSSLNSFHSSGLRKANLTGGLKRIEELLNVTKKPHTPSLTIFFDPKQINTQSLQDVRKVCFEKVIWQRLSQIEFDPNELGSFYSIHSILCDESYKQSSKWRIRLHLNNEKMWKSNITISYIVGIIEANINCNYRLSFVWSSDLEGILDIWIHEQFLQNVSNILSKIKHVKQEKIDEIEKYVNGPNNQQMKLFCKKMLFNILNLPITGINQVEDVFFSKSKKNEWYIDTIGGDLKDMLTKDFIDVKQSSSNNVWEILNIFGIDAAREFLKQEFLKQIKINPRHLELLINVMTHSGKLRSVSRHGIDRKEVGPLTKASFEQPIDNFLISATLAERDNISSVSAAVMVGKLSNIGTNAFGVRSFTDIETLKKTLQQERYQSYLLRQKQNIKSYHRHSTNVNEVNDDEMDENDDDENDDDEIDGDDDELNDLLESDLYKPDDDEANQTVNIEEFEQDETDDIPIPDDDDMEDNYDDDE